MYIFLGILFVIAVVYIVIKDNEGKAQDRQATAKTSNNEMGLLNREESNPDIYNPDFYYGNASGVTIITTNCVRYGHIQGKSIIDKRRANFTAEEIVNTSYVTTTKNASVVGRAAAGYVIGGTTGALVGAASAVNTNNRGGKTTTKVVGEDHTGRYLLRLNVPNITPGYDFRPYSKTSKNRISPKIEQKAPAHILSVLLTGEGTYQEVQECAEWANKNILEK